MKVNYQYQATAGAVLKAQALLDVPTEDTYCLITMKVLRQGPLLQKLSVDGHFIYPGHLVIHVPPKKP